jgi:TonB family protein
MRLVVLALTLLLSAAAASQDETECPSAGPVAVLRVPPEYPSSPTSPTALEADCGMTFDVVADGGVDPASIVASCTNTRFIRAAERAVAQWRYDPSTVSGGRQTVETVLEFRFAEEAFATPSHSTHDACSFGEGGLVDNFPSPAFPAEAVAQGVDGFCAIAFDVLADGRVDSETTSVSCTSELFVRSVEEAVKRWSYPPPDGGVTCRKEDTFEFVGSEPDSGADRSQR